MKNRRDIMLIGVDMCEGKKNSEDDSPYLTRFIDVIH